VKALIMLMLYVEQARRRPIWSLCATWRPWAPHWWPLFCINWDLYFMQRKFAENRAYNLFWNKSLRSHCGHLL